VIRLGLLLLVITACQPKEGKLSFETIAQDDGFYTGRSHGEEKPAILVIASTDEIDEPGLGVLFPTELADELRQMDYDRVFAILVLQGVKSQGGFSVTVQRIDRQDDRVSVYAEFTNPEPGTRRTQGFTSPYHLAAVSKRGEWGQHIDFVLVTDSEEVAETSHFIP
jgi:hypothetical protein